MFSLLRKSWFLLFTLFLLGCGAVGPRATPLPKEFQCDIRMSSRPLVIQVGTPFTLLVSGKLDTTEPVEYHFDFGTQPSIQVLSVSNPRPGQYLVECKCTKSGHHVIHTDLIEFTACTDKVCLQAKWLTHNFPIDFVIVP